jgi:hypothetical protein
MTGDLDEVVEDDRAESDRFIANAFMQCDNLSNDKDPSKKVPLMSNANEK